jgi:hypothetical protein
MTKKNDVKNKLNQAIRNIYQIFNNWVKNYLLYLHLFFRKEIHKIFIEILLI